jgi:hypothetical protein
MVGPRLVLATWPNIYGRVETTGSSLAVTVGYMAIHDDIQEEVVEQIMSVLGPDCDPVWSQSISSINI